MRVQKVPVSKIQPAPYNPRRSLRPEDPEYQRILRSLDEFGMVEPVIWNENTGNLVGGHQRFGILVAQGHTEVVASVVNLPLAKEKLLNIALNRIAGRWDERKLADLLDEITKTPDFDVELTGFDLTDVEQLLARVSADGKGPDEVFDPDAAFSDARATITKPGELIELGSHRVLCGDATKPESYAALLRGAKASLMFSDPPYGVAYDTSQRPTAPRSKRSSPAWMPIKSDALRPEQYARWFRTFVSACVDALAPGAPFYIWHGHANFGLMHDVLRQNDCHTSTVITWAKESFSPGFGDFNEQTEFALYGWKKGATHRFFGPKNESTLWSIPRDRTGNYKHPTQKALPLAERAIRNSSRPGDLVLDPFLGSGTTLVAAARKGRRCFGIEIEPTYCDVIVRRFIALAGPKAVSAKLLKRYGASGAAR
ncbi:MAG: ParB N-terminal domain-containing protein [Planctomycetes bacterium]|nr:ParB N-terminal domain-containing protein [Planctomycetota bacterium]MCC7173179.1 ParB N-terminal domain-containing protein [Planctomycetota bacterium]